MHTHRQTYIHTYKSIHRTQCFKNTLHGRNTAAPSIRSTGLDRKSRICAIQGNANWSTKANKHKDRKTLQYRVKRGIVYNHKFKNHSHQNKETAELYKIFKGNSYKNFQIDHDNLPK